MTTITKFSKATGIHFTLNHNDKMQGLASLSTSPLCNEHCKARRENKDMICAHCYSMAMNKRYTNLAKSLERNTDILATILFEESDMPRLISETGYFRFEAFGDLVNEIQVANYFRMANANPHMKCALWTKNPWIIASAIKAYGLKKPANLTIIGSSYYTNTPMDFSGYDFIDKVFTVYDKKTATEKGIDINCGGRSCADCGRCYENYGGRVVSELLK